MRLHELELLAHDMDRLRRLLDRLETDADVAQSRRGQGITSLMREILLLLPNDERVELCIPYLVHRHRHRRLMACGLLRALS